MKIADEMGIADSLILMSASGHIAPMSSKDALAIEAALAAAPQPGQMELFGHWSKHKLADGVLLPLGCYVPEGPDYTTIPLYRSALSAQVQDAPESAEEVKPVAFIVREALGELKKHCNTTATVWSGRTKLKMARAGVALYERPPAAAALLEEAMRAFTSIIERSDNGEPGTSKVKDMRLIAVAALEKVEARIGGAT